MYLLPCLIFILWHLRRYVTVCGIRLHARSVAVGAFEEEWSLAYLPFLSSFALFCLPRGLSPLHFIQHSWLKCGQNLWCSERVNNKTVFIWLFYDVRCWQVILFVLLKLIKNCKTNQCHFKALSISSKLSLSISVSLLLFNIRFCPPKNQPL